MTNDTDEMERVPLECRVSGREMNMAGRPQGSRNKKPHKWWIPDGVKVRKYDWEIIGQEYDYEKRRLYYFARCACGNESRVIADNVVRGQSKRCASCSAKIAAAARNAAANV